MNKKIILGVFILGGFSAWLLMVTKPETQRITPPVSSPLVAVTSITKGPAHLSVKALGTVKAAQETIVRTQVAGQVKELGHNFEAGGLLNKGDLILQLDKADYENALAIKEAALIQAHAEHDLEMGQQRAARVGLELFRETAPNTAGRDMSLVLRNPQAAQAEAIVKSADVEVKQARLELERTRILAPYNALVVERQVSLGSQATPSESVARIVGTDEYRIEAAIPLDRLQALGLEALNGATAQIYLATGAQREGRVLHAIASVDTTTRLGRVVISVPDPLGLNSDQSALLLGDHVRVELSAGELKEVVRLPRSTLRGNDTVWVAHPGEDGLYVLDIRPVTVAWKDNKEVIISGGLEEGEQIIISPLGAAVPNMPVRVEGAVTLEVKPTSPPQSALKEVRPDKTLTQVDNNQPSLQRRSD